MHDFNNCIDCVLWRHRATSRLLSSSLLIIGVQRSVRHSVRPSTIQVESRIKVTFSTPMIAVSIKPSLEIDIDIRFKQAPAPPILFHYYLKGY